MKVMIVDDHPLMRVGIAAIINARTDMTVVAQAGTGEAGRHALSKAQARYDADGLAACRGMGGVDAIAAIRPTISARAVHRA